MFYLHIHKENDKYYCTGINPKVYPWECDSDFPDVDIPGHSWKDLSAKLYYDATDNSILIFPNKERMTVAQFNKLVQDQPATLDAHCIPAAE